MCEACAIKTIDDAIAEGVVTYEEARVFTHAAAYMPGTVAKLIAENRAKDQAERHLLAQFFGHRPEDVP